MTAHIDTSHIHKLFVKDCLIRTRTTRLIIVLVQNQIFTLKEDRLELCNIVFICSIPYSMMINNIFFFKSVILYLLQTWINVFAIVWTLHDKNVLFFMKIWFRYNYLYHCIMYILLAVLSKAIQFFYNFIVMLHTIIYNYQWYRNWTTYIRYF